MYVNAYMMFSRSVAQDKQMNAHDIGPSLRNRDTCFLVVTSFKNHEIC